MFGVTDKNFWTALVNMLKWKFTYFVLAEDTYVPITHPISASNSCSLLSPFKDHNFILTAGNMEYFKLASTVQCLYKVNRRSFSNMIFSEVRTSVSLVLFCRRLTWDCKGAISMEYCEFSIFPKSICSVKAIMASQSRSLSSLLSFQASSKTRIAL